MNCFKYVWYCKTQKINPGISIHFCVKVFKKTYNILVYMYMCMYVCMQVYIYVQSLIKSICPTALYASKIKTTQCSNLRALNGDVKLRSMSHFTKIYIRFLHTVCKINNIYIILSFSLLLTLFFLMSSSELSSTISLNYSLHLTCFCLLTGKFIRERK